MTITVEQINNYHYKIEQIKKEMRETRFVIVKEAGEIAIANLMRAMAREMIDAEA